MKSEIAYELVKILQKLGASTELLCCVGSYGDTQTDEDVLQYLKEYNEWGTGMHKILVSEHHSPTNSH